LACWIKRLDDKDENVARKATYMLARLGRGKDEAVNALVAKIDDPRELVRGDVLSALDFVAIKGSSAGVQKIDQVRRAEDGRAIWNHVKERALSTQARLVGRAK
jgi:HEAT repeat protein